MKLGIDLGGTKIELIALEEGESQMQEVYRKRVATPKDSYNSTVVAICSLVKGAEKTLGKKGSLGIGIPGTISAETGLVKNANSTCLIGHPLDIDLQKRLDREVRISNDANCMTISEASDGAGKEGDIVFGVIVGTGCGGGISVNKKIITGSNKVTGEWGHNPLPWKRKHDGVNIRCYCGHDNCVETYLSGPGFLKRYHAQAEEAESVQQIVQLAEQGYEPAEQALQEYELNMAKALSGVINLLDPNIIVLAGGLSNIQRLYSNVPKLWHEFVFSDTVNTQLVQAKHGDSSGVRGAAWLW